MKKAKREFCLWFVTKILCTTRILLTTSLVSNKVIDEKRLRTHFFLIRKVLTYEYLTSILMKIILHDTTLL